MEDNFKLYIKQYIQDESDKDSNFKAKVDASELTVDDVYNHILNSVKQSNLCAVSHEAINKLIRDCYNDDILKEELKAKPSRIVIPTELLTDEIKNNIQKDAEEEYKKQCINDFKNKQKKVKESKQIENQMSLDDFF